ncbi:MAG: 4Fe-4S binding protein [Candidatus Omnitrophota bacterium]
MRYPKLRELREAIRAIFKGPYTSKFPQEPHIPYERFRGRPYFHEEDCIGCTACAQVCPARAIEFKDEVANLKGKRKFILHWDICIFCGNCQANCPTEKGIILSQEFALATTENRALLIQEMEKELVLCSCCGDVVVPVDQYSWVSKRLGVLIFSNSSLMLFYLRKLGVALQEKFSPKKEMEFQRSDRIKVLCPRCRREAVIKS